MKRPARRANTRPTRRVVIGSLDASSADPRLLIDAIMGDQPVTPNFYDGLKVQEAIDTALESHRNERWVSLS
ncbi:MAG: hypothetical protein GY801_41050 [bacterium]|nr:hypothetical protein [bacterium]